jgi:hypothetical protein
MYKTTIEEVMLMTTADGRVEKGQFSGRSS